MELKDSMPAMSIIVPVYNVKDELPRCIDSIIKQTMSDFELILVDDGSTDGSAEICDGYSKKDIRIKVFHKQNGGLSSARNFGLNEATGRWVMYVDSDDYIALDACGRLYSIAKSTDSEIIAGNAVHVIGDRREYWRHSCFPEGKTLSFRDYIIASIRKGEYYAPACFYMYSRDFLLENALYFVEGLSNEDLEMQPRLFLAANKISYCDYDFYYYIDRPTSLIHTADIPWRARTMERVYCNWLAKIEAIEDIELSEVYKGFLAKCFIKSYLDYFEEKSIQVEGIDGWFLVKNSLNAKEFIKAILFTISPKLLCSLRGLLK